MYPTSTDLLMIAGFQPVKWGSTTATWQPVFQPKEFMLQNPNLVIDQYHLDPEQLKQYGIYISRVREVIREQAVGFDQQVG